MTLLLLVFIPLSSVFAADDWTACKKSSECTVSEDSCDKPIPLNKKFIKENDSVNARSQCGEQYKGFPKETFAVACKDKRCSLEKKSAVQRCQAVKRTDSSDQLINLEFEIDGRGIISRKAFDGSVYKEKWLLVSCPESATGKCLREENSKEILPSDCK